MFRCRVVQRLLLDLRKIPFCTRIIPCFEPMTQLTLSLFEFALTGPTMSHSTSLLILGVLLFSVTSIAHDHSPEQNAFKLEKCQESLKESTWLDKYGPQIDQSFSGPLSFSHLPYTRCLENEETKFDIAILGMPFDTAVTYRPGFEQLIVILSLRLTLGY